MEEREEEVTKNNETRELILDRKKIARMKERRACIILGKLFSRFSVRDTFHLIGDSSALSQSNKKLR